MRRMSCLSALVFCVFFVAIPAFSEEEIVDSPSVGMIESESLASAMGHYARARSLLIAAIREFDSGTMIANPDILIDSKEWRGSLLARSEELERVLAPQPRTSKTGVRYQSDSRLLREANGK